MAAPWRHIPHPPTPANLVSRAFRGLFRGCCSKQLTAGLPATGTAIALSTREVMARTARTLICVLSVSSCSHSHARPRHGQRDTGPQSPQPSGPVASWGGALSTAGGRAPSQRPVRLPTPTAAAHTGARPRPGSPDHGPASKSSPRFLTGLRDPARGSLAASACALADDVGGPDIHPPGLSLR